MRHWILLSLLLLIVSAPSYAGNTAQNHLNQLGEYPLNLTTQYLTADIDETLETVQHSDQWQYFDQGNSNFAYSQKNYWFKTSVLLGEAVEKTRWYFKLVYPAIDYLTLYLCENEHITRIDKQCKILRTGDLLTFDQRDKNNPNFILELPLKVGENYLFIHMVTGGSYQLPASLIDEHNLDDYLALNALLRGGLYGMLAVMIFYNLFIYVTARTKSYLIYSIYVTSYLVFLLSYEGSGFQYLWPNWPELNRHLLPITLSLSPAIALTFVISFLGLSPSKGYSYYWLTLLRLLILGTMILSLWLPYATIIKYINVLTIIMPISALSVGIIYSFKGQKSARLFTLAWGIFLIGILMAGLRNFSLLPSNFLTLYGYQIGSFFEVVLLSLALGYRIQELQEDKILNKHELLKVQNQSINNLQLYEGLYQTSISGQFKLDQNFTIIKSNPSFRKIIARESEVELINSHIPLFDVLKEGAIKDRFLIEVNNESIITAFVLPLITKDQNGLYISLTMNKVTEDGITEWHGSLLDISDKIERQKREKYDQEQRMYSLKQMVMGVSHEMNTPIGNIRLSESYLNALVEESVNQLANNTLNKQNLIDNLSQQAEALASINTSSSRLSELTKSFKGVAVQKSDYQVIPFDSHELLAQWADEHEFKHHIQYVPQASLLIESYPAALLEVLNQLCENSIEHNSALAIKNTLEIDVRFQRREKHALLIYRDNGSGLDAADCQDLFLPFFTKSRGQKKKLGLGMYFVYNLVGEVLNGNISVKSIDDGIQGLEITITIPLNVTVTEP